MAIPDHTYTVVDTSVWIDYFKGIQKSETDLLEELIKQDFATVCPTIIQEILQGIRDNRDYEKVKTSLLNLRVLTIEDQVETAIGSAEIYRR